MTYWGRMNQAAYDAIEDLWKRTVKARALCPYHDKQSAVGETSYSSPDWYKKRGAVFLVNLATPLTSTDVEELFQIAHFINGSFVISMSATLESYGVVEYGKPVIRTRQGGNHVQLTRWLRNQFAHGAWKYDAAKREDLKTRKLLVKLFPSVAHEPGFDLSIDAVLEPLKDGVLAYVKATP
jgi:hypothetical protein